MTVETAASSPEPFPGTAESAARLTRLHDALKQLRAKSAATMPLTSLAPGVSAAPAATETVLPPLLDEAPALANATSPLSSPAEAAAEYAPLPERQSSAADEAVSAPDFESRSLQKPSDPAPASAPPIAASQSAEPESVANAAAYPAEELPAAKPFDLEAWFSNVDLRQYRQLAGNLASHVASGDSIAIAVATLSSGREAPRLAARLAICLAEREEGDVLLIERSERRLGPPGPTRSASLVDVVAGRATWSDATAATEMPGLRVIDFGGTAASEDVPASEPWRMALADLKRKYRYVVGGPGPGESVAGDAWLSTIDGVYLAVGLGDISRGAVAAYQARLKACGARLLGSIALR